MLEQVIINQADHIKNENLDVQALVICYNTFMYNVKYLCRLKMYCLCNNLKQIKYIVFFYLNTNNFVQFLFIEIQIILFSFNF